MRSVTAVALREAEAGMLRVPATWCQPKALQVGRAANIKATRARGRQQETHSVGQLADHLVTHKSITCPDDCYCCNHLQIDP